MEKIQSHPAIPEKIIMVHTFAILAVCIIFGVISIISTSLVNGLIIIGSGVAATVVSFILKNKTAPMTRGFILSILQLCIILIVSGTTTTMQDMFPLMLASLAIAAIYYNKTCIIVHWIIMDVASIVGLIFKDFFYGDTSIVALIKGIAGINVGAFLIIYLLKCSLGFITQAEEAKANANDLLDRVKEQMEETERMAEAQTTVVHSIASVSHTLSISGEKMDKIAASINQAAEEQQTTIGEIAEDISAITAEAQRSLESAEAASKAAADSTHLLELSNEEFSRMMDAMAEIEESSDKIRNIVKTIEDIAFQTNILALNASIEAARAGAAGKGFAVVADEVRNLAGKSQSAVENTAELIDASVDAVHRGKEIADAVAERMSSVMSTAEASAEHADSIAKLTESQVSAITAVSNRMEQMSMIIAQTSHTAMESAEIASSVAAEAHKMDDIVQNFR